MRRLFLLLIVCFLVSCNNKTNYYYKNTDVSSGEPLVVAMELNNQPFEYLVDSENPDGVTVELVEEFAKYLKRELTIKDVSAENMLASIEDGETHILASSIVITPEKKELLNFSDPYAVMYLSCLVGLNSNIKDFAEVDKEDVKIVVVAGSTAHTYVSSHIKNAEIVPFLDFDTCIDELNLNNAQAFISSQIDIHKIYNSEEKEIDFIDIPIPLQDPIFLGVGFNKDDVSLRSDFNTFLVEYKIKGGLDALTEKHLSDEKAFFDKMKYDWIFDFSHIGDE